MIATRRIIAARPARRKAARIQHAAARQTRRIIYVASPVSTYATRTYDRMCQHASRYYPNCELLTGRSLFRSNFDWRRRWPSVLAKIHELIFFADACGWIGRGVSREIGDATAREIPVSYLATTGALIPLSRVRFSEPDVTDWRRYCRILGVRRQG